MSVIYWTVAIIMGAPLGIGIAFLLFGSMLNKSNNLGDSRSKNEEFTSEIFYLSQENHMSHSAAKFTAYAEMNMETMIGSREYADRAREAIKAPPQALVERYIPGSENDTGEEFEASEGAAGAASIPQESAWAMARRKNLKEAASESPWGRDDKWGAKIPDVSESSAVSSVTPEDAASAPAPLAEPTPVEEPIYEAPTATRPLWLNSNPDDDFSDFEDM
ncbi:MAG: hypothetical protein IK020_04590 [Clostridiales bacterium]|nr:hypothetical protein [Clostridiales bacterium]